MLWRPDSHPDANLRTSQLSVARFNALVSTLAADDDRTAADRDYEVCLAALAGRYFDHHRGIERRIFLNAREDADMPPRSATYAECDEHHYRVHRDYDSMFGMTKQLPYNRSLHVYPVAPFRDTLTTPVHLMYPVCKDGRTTLVELGKIPNVEFAKIDVHTKVNIMFPGMYQPHRDRRISVKLLADLYEQVTLPSLRDIRYEHIDHWPVDYAHADIKARGTKGYHFSMVEIPSWSLRSLALKMRARMNAIPLFKGAFFYHEVRGVKGGNHHNPENPGEATTALRAVFDHLDFTQLTEDDLQYHWFVDVALQVQHPGHVVHWSSSSHANILSHLLSNATPTARENLLRSENFHLDVCAHLSDVAGFRVATPSVGRGNNVHYINVYSTEKELHYQLHSGVFKRPDVRDLLPANMQRLIKQADTWSDVFVQAMGRDGRAGSVESAQEQAGRPLQEVTPPQEGQARLEIRVPASMCGTTLIEVPEELITRSCITVPAVEWWSFKYWRLLACYLSLSQLGKSTAVARANDRALQFGAGLVHIMGGLLYRKELRAPWPDLERNLAMYQHEDVDSDEELDDDDFESPAMIPVAERQGAFFFATIERVLGTYNCSGDRILDVDLLTNLYGTPDIHTLAMQFGVHSIQKRVTKAHPGRRNNRHPQTVDLTDARTQPPPKRNFGLHAQNITLVPVGFVTRGAGRVRHIGRTADQVLNDIWETFKSDVIQKAPQPKSRSDEPYLTLDPLEHVNASDDIFTSSDIPFRKASLIPIDAAEWNGLFCFYFPMQGHTYPGRIQNLDTCTYLKQWNSIVLGQNADVVDAVRKALRKHFATLLWLPYNESERMWTTKSITASKGQMCPPRAKAPCPVLAVNKRQLKGRLFRPRAKPDAILDTGLIVAEDEEEDDGGGEEPIEGEVEEGGNDDRQMRVGGENRRGLLNGYTAEQIRMMREEEESDGSA